MKLDRKSVNCINGTVYLVEDKKEEKTAGGIILADNVEQDRMHTGTVIDVSPFLLEDGRLIDPPVRPGDKVIYSQHAGAGAVWIDDIDKLTYRLVKWNELLAVIRNEKS